MWPQIPRSSFHNGPSPLSKHSSKTAYAEFMENCHKLYGDLDDHS